ncbi:hypothetical protein [Phenylobacterium sp.]|uniref:hypothetical protein n=1 Tax=Phenylobacterium sp. TaxID=1871053 RepID=UPI0025FA6EB5|nr:hypothetical protein [Phenylobacterium sp.]MBX3485122.1 hypothetical protein [Phenylobacterium sp.]
MIDEFDERLRLHLDKLETRGRRYLFDAGRRTALRLALIWAAPACLGGALLVLIWGCFEPLNSIAAISTAILIPAIVAIANYLWRLPRRSPDRRTTLALFDHLFGLKDRAVASDQFRKSPSRNGFEEAALAEAHPWIDRLLDIPLEPPDRPSPLWSWRWLFPVSALLVLCLAIIVPHRRASDPNSAGGVAQAPERNLSADVTTAPPANSPALGAMTPKTETRLLDDRSRMMAPLDELGSIMGARIQGALGALGLRRDGSGPEAEAGVAPPRSSAGHNAAEATPGLKSTNEGAQSEGGFQATSARNKESPEAAPSVRSNEGFMRSEEAVAPSEAIASPSHAGAMMQDPSSQRSAPPKQGGSQQSDGDKGQQPGRRRRSDQNSNSREQGADGSENGRGAGDEAAAKKGRGVASLLLALPMQDRLAGVASNGRVGVTMREGRPQAIPVQQAPAGDRGVNRGGMGVSPYHNDTAHEQRLLSDYFTRSGAPDGD